MTRVLYIDDESALLTLTQLYLKEEAGFDVDIASSAEEGLELLKITRFDAIISDYEMPDIDGIEFLKLVRANDLAIPFIIFTGKGREEVAIEALNNGADFYIQKGGDPQTIFTELANAIRHLVRRTCAERAAIQSEQHLIAFLNAMPDIAFIKGPDLRYLLINPAFQTFLNLPAMTNAIGKNDEDLFPAELAKICRNSDEKVRDLKISSSNRETLDGRTYLIQKFPLPFPTGMIGVGGIIRDVTDHHQIPSTLHK